MIPTYYYHSLDFASCMDREHQSGKTNHVPSSHLAYRFDWHGVVEE